MGEIERAQFTRRDLEAVIRRAAELESEGRGELPELSEADVFRIAGEVGLSQANVRRAVAEHRAGAALEPLIVDRGWASRLCGPGLISASRRVPASASEVQERLERHLHSGEGLRLVRRTRSISLWEPEKGVLASLTRSVDLFGRGYQLAKKAQALELRVVPVAERESEVTFTVDLGNERAGWFWGLGVAVGGGAAAASGAVVVGLSLPLVTVAWAPALLGAGVWLARAGYARSLRNMQVVLEGLLDRLEHGDALEPPRPSWRDLLR
jgi:hypothetical protein